MPTLETINVGLAANDKKGDPLRNAMQKVNLNFSALNEAIVGVFAPTTIPSGVDLNTMVTAGVFHQNTNAGAAAGTNYPTPYAGLLQVFTGGAMVYQFYTRFRAGGPFQAQYWRALYQSTWSEWVEVASSQTALTYQGGLASGVDLNAYTQRGMWVQGSSASAASGTNYPIAQSGYLLVQSAGYPGGTTATGCAQVYHAANSNRSFFRSLIGTTWSAWEETVRSSLLGAAGGIAQLGADSRLLPAQAPVIYSTSVTAGTDANALIAPGVYYTNSDAQATAALNWPEQLAGTLNVEVAVTGNSQVTQTYTTRNGTGGVSRTYKRVRFGAGAGTWGLWQQLARFDDAMSHVYLGAAGVDCNTLIADNTYYTIDQAGAVTSGSNWPPTSSIIGGGVEVRRQAASRIFQTVTLLVGSNMKPRIFFRYGDPTSGNWQSWTMISSLSSVGWLPTANCGDVYVDGVGWHRWNGTAYEMSALAPLLPTVAHDLNSYQTPGTYRQGTVAGATAGTNYPIAIGGYLEVISGGTGSTVQRYTVASTAPIAATGGGPRLFWRVAIGSTWGQWQEAPTRDLAVTHTFLTAATDCNTLTADNTFYTWAAAAYAAGANFPGYQASGYMQVFWISATNVSQEMTLLVSGGKPLKFARFGNPSTGVWQPWKVTSAFNSTAWMPTSNMGDIYVDGLGWHSWNGTSYKLTLAGRDHGQCRFDYVNAATCRLMPYDGNGLIINGRQYRIPAAGVILGNTSLTAQTLHYIYAYDDGAGIILLEASTTGFSTHTDGVTIKTGDPSRTLVGMAITPASGLFVYNNTLRYVSSYFNRKLMTIIEYVGASTSSLNTPVALNNGCGCLTWGGSVQLHATGQVNANGSTGAYLSLRINGTAALGGWGYTCPGSGGWQVPYAMVGPWYAGPGLITLQTYGYVNVSGYTLNITQDQGITYEG